MPTDLSIPAAARALVVFARAPEPGRVKTRLAATIGVDAALVAYRALGTGVMRALAPLADECALVVAGTPDHGEPALRAWLGDGFGFDPQGAGELGARMKRAMRRRFAAGAAQVAIVGTDCPGVDAARVRDAFARLDTCDAVLGPATDGGYWLVGARAASAEVALDALFDDVPWSSPDTLRVTLERAARSGLRVALLEELRDVDDEDDWRAWLLAGVSRQAPPPPA